MGSITDPQSQSWNPVDYDRVYPELNGYLLKPLLVSPPMCMLHQLQDGTYSIVDLEVMHQVIEIKEHAATQE